MKKSFLILFFIATLKCDAQKKIEWRGCYVGTQVISPILSRQKLMFSPSVYVIALAGIKRFTFNTQIIIPYKKNTTSLIKFGLDYKLF